jgi:carbonic anhydrase/acetyltransferase-like protein (isoleucine patch superfamily)
MPRIHDTAWVAPNATIVGDVTIDQDVGVWYATVIRADTESITIGYASNIQDGCVLHSDPGYPLLIGSGVTVGHGAILHGCRISDDVLVGMGSIVMNGASIGTGCVIGAGTLISEGVTIPAHSVVFGAPGKIQRPTSQDEGEAIRIAARHYVERRPTT